MKILYVTSDGRAAEQAALSLRAAVPGIRVVWAASFGDALRWIDSNRGVLALVVEVASDMPSCELFVTQVRALGLTAPVIIVTVKEPAPTPTTLTAIADEIVAKTPSFFSDLPQIVGRVLRKERPGSPPARRPLQFVYIGDAALARACFAGSRSIQVIEAAPGSNRKLDCLPADVRSGVPLSLDVLFIEHGYPGVDTHSILRDIAARKLHVPVVIVAEWDEEFAALSFKLGAVDYVAKSEASFQAVVFRMGRLLTHAARFRAAGSDEAAATREQLALREAEYTEKIARVEREQHALAEKLAMTEAALRKAEQRLDEERRAAESRLTEDTGAIEKLEQRIARAAERHAHIDAELGRQIAKVDVLERERDAAKLALHRAEERHTSEATAADGRFIEQQARYEARLADAAAAQGALQAQLVSAAKQLADAQSAHRRAEQAHASETVAAAALEAKLGDAIAALTRAEAGAAVDRRTAADEAVKRRAEFDGQLATEVATRQALAQQLTDAEAAYRHLEHRHASELSAAATRFTASESEAKARSAETAVVISTLERKLADTAAALERVEQQAAADQQAASEEAARRQVEFDQVLAKQLADAQSAHRRAEQEHAAEIAAAAALEAKLVDAIATREALAQQLTDAEAAYRHLEHRHASELSAAAARFTASENEAKARSAETAVVISTLERKLADTAATLERVEQQAVAEQQAASEEANRRQVEFDQALAKQLADAQSAHRRAEQEHSAEIAAAGALEAKLVDAIATRQALAQQLTDAEAAYRHLEQRHESDLSSAAARFTASENEAKARSAETAAVIDMLERRLADSAATVERVERQAAADQQAASEEAARRQVEFDQALAQQLTDAEAAYRHLEQRHASELSAAAARFTASENEAKARSAETAAAIDALERRLVDTAATLKRVERQAVADQHVAVEEAARRQVEFDQALAQQLTDAEAAYRHLEQRHASELSAAATRFTASENEAKARSAETAVVIDTLERRLVDTAATLKRVEQQAVTDQHVAVEEAARRQVEFDTELTHEAARREALAKQLADARSAHRRAEQEHAAAIAAAAALEAKLGDAIAALTRAEAGAAADRQIAADEAVQRRAEFDGQLAAEAATRQALAQQLTAAEAAYRHLEQRHASELSAVAEQERRAAIEEAARRQAEFDSALAQQVANQQALQDALVHSESAHQRAKQQHASEIEAAAARFTEYQKENDAQLAQAAADFQEGLRNAKQRAATERQMAAEHAADRQAKVEAELGREIARREALERELADVRVTAEEAQRRFLDEADALRQRAREHEARIERAEKERIESEHALADIQNRTQQLASDHEQERATFDRARMALEGDLASQRAEYTALHRILDQTRTTAEEALASSSSERAAERVRFEALVAERDSQLRDQSARQRASDEVAAKKLADAEHRLKLTLEAGYRDRQTIAHLQEQLTAVEAKLDATRRQREVLQAEADRVPQLRKDIDDIRAEHRRHFDHAPVSMCRCTQDGTVVLANHAFAKFLGYETPEELKKVDLAASVFESTDELQWIVERCLGSHSTESVETTWTKKDGSRIVVRVLAVATAPDSIEMTAEDITTLRVLEEKLRIAQRMEAVARYASEVAVTCDHLLGHVEQEGLRWLARIDSDTARYHGELLLEEVTRAAKYLRQLSVYGNEEKKVSDLVDLHKLLRDLEPVLKRVAGSEIDLVLPKAATSLNLDVEAERVERMLVNVAAYGRERMPLGGRLMFEVAPVVVDRKFVAKYPNVRPGAHVLLTVNEVRGAGRPGASAIASASNSPGVDLGALQALVSGCGGHLWMTVEPPGDMVLKIHLPRRVLDRPDPRPPAKASVRARWIGRATGVRH